MTEQNAAARIVTAERTISAPAEVIFELIADPAQQPTWDGNDNLAASSSPRIRAIGETFGMDLTSGKQRENHVVEFEEGTLIAWMPAPVGEQPRGHVWRWELESVDEATTRVVHTYDWTNLTDESRFARALATTSESLTASLEKLDEAASGAGARASD